MNGTVGTLVTALLVAGLMSACETKNATSRTTGSGGAGALGGSALGGGGGTAATAAPGGIGGNPSPGEGGNSPIGEGGNTPIGQGGQAGGDAQPTGGGGGTGAPGGGGAAGQAGGAGTAGTPPAGPPCSTLFATGIVAPGRSDQEVLADLDGDGAPELITVDADYLVTAMNDGHGHFPAEHQYPVVSRLRAGVATADVDSDGHVDVVVAHGAELGNLPLTRPRVGIRLNNGDGTLGDEIVREVPSSVYWVALGDVDGDHRPDLVAGGVRLYVMLNKGDGQFGEALLLLDDSSDVYYGGPIALADLDGDGRLDIVWSASHLNVLTNQGQLAFTASTIPVPHASSTSLDAYADAVVATDLNGDGRLDIATIGTDAFDFSTLSATGFTLNVLLNDGHGTFVSSYVATLPDDQGPALVSGDFDADGRPDLAVTSGGLSLFLSRPGGGYALSVCSVPSPARLVAGDLNGDGKIDLADGLQTLINVAP